MNPDDTLRIQAWIDGELTPSQAQDVARLVEEDADARHLFTELRWTKTALAAGEINRELPESREFYWSKIRRAIETPGSTRALSASAHWKHWMIRWLAPAGIVAALALLVGLPLLHKPEEPWVSGTEIESPLSDISSFTFRSESERMTVVWVNTY